MTVSDVSGILNLKNTMREKARIASGILLNDSRPFLDGSLRVPAPVEGLPASDLFCQAQMMDTR